MAAWTTDDLLSAVKRKCQLTSAANGKLSDQEILDIANEEMQTGVASLIRRARESIWSYHEDITIVDGTSDYHVPPQAMGGALKEVKIVDSSGNAFDVPRVDESEIDHYTVNPDPWWPNGVAFALSGDFLVLLPTPNAVFAGDTLRLRYTLRPSTLILTTSSDTTSVITSVSEVSTQRRLNVASTNNIVASVETDVIAIDGSLLLVDELPYDISVDSYVTYLSTSQHVADQTPASIYRAVGGYVALAGLTPVPQVPQELRWLLVRLTAVSVLEEIGDRPGAALAQAKLQERVEQVEDLINDRVENAAPKIINRHSPLRTGRQWRRGWR